MLNITAYAVRFKGVIHVTVSGDLQDSCHSAKITDKYPVGNIVYVKDPGSAQIFIEETVKPSPSICIFKLVPWARHISIIDDQHDTVTVYINDQPVATARVLDDVVPLKEGSQSRVIARTGTSYEGCSVIPADAPYLGIYTSVFGPETKPACDRWVAESCGRSSDASQP